MTEDLNVKEKKLTSADLRESNGLWPFTLSLKKIQTVSSFFIEHVEELTKCHKVIKDDDIMPNDLQNFPIMTEIASTSHQAV